jgi:antitoxin VapB
VPDIAKIFMNGRSQAVRLPAAYRFDTDQVFIRKDPNTGEVILSARPTSWDGFFEALDAADFPADFLDPNDRAQGRQDRDPLDGVED